MPRGLAPIYSFNTGEVSKLSLARLDLQKMRVAGSYVKNWLPTVLGPMMFRPGFEHIGTIPNATGTPPSGYTADDGSLVKLIPFIRGTGDTAIIELTPGKMRLWVDDTILTRPSVSAAMTNGTFSGSLTGWAVVSSANGSATATASGLEMSLPALGGTVYVRQTVLTASANVEHALRIEVTRGPVSLRIGSTAGGEEFSLETKLGTGLHSIAFTPTASAFHIQLSATTYAPRIVKSVAIEAAGVVELATPYDMVGLRRFQRDQSIDVVFCADGRNVQKRIERRGRRSWSIVDYEARKGPLQTARRSDVKLSASATRGVITLTSTAPYFRQDHVGTLFRLFNTGQNTSCSIGAGGEWSDPIRITGIGSDRFVTIGIAGTWSGTVVVQRSFDGPDSGYTKWYEFTSNYGPVVTTEPNNNAIVYVRIGFPDGLYTSGVADMTFKSDNGGGEGFARIVDYSSSTSATAVVVDRLYNTAPTSDWYESRWSDYSGWPSSVGIYDGRLWWGIGDTFAGSVSDSYDNFDLSVTGDSGPVIRSIGYGGVETSRWILPLQRLLVGTSGSEISVRSSAFDSPITPTDMTARNASTFGSAPVRPAIIDRTGIFVAKDQRTICELAYSVDAQDYVSKDLTELNPTLFDSPVIDIAVQRHPDTRIWFALLDGTARCLTYERGNEVVAWSRIETDGDFLGFTVLPASEQDNVYAAIRRDGVVYLERMAHDSEARGEAVTCNVDAFVRYAGAATTTISGLSHLNGKQVYAWSSTKKGYGPLTVSSGQVTLPEAVTSCVVGLSYSARFKSAKLGHVAAQTALGQRKRVDRLSLSLCDTHHNAILFGGDEQHLDPLPGVVEEEVIEADKVWDDIDLEMSPANGSWNADSRFVIDAVSPYPATVRAAVISVASHDAA